MTGSKKIVMLQGVGNNERGWARLVSKSAKTTLIQQGVIQHVEIWHNGILQFCGPEESVTKTRFLDEITLSSLTIFRYLRRFFEQEKNEKTYLLIAANYSGGIAALLLRLFGRAEKIVLTLSDHLPPKGSWLVRTHRRLTELLTWFVARRVDQVWSVSSRIPAAAANPNHFVFPICIDDYKSSDALREKIGYIGFPSKDHALEKLFEIARNHDLKLNVVGQSPYLDSIKHLAPANTTFYGTVTDPNKIRTIISECFCGYAVYENTGPSSYSYYGIPSKSFYYFASNTPVVTTKTAEFTGRIEEFKIGKVVAPDLIQIEKAILEIKADYPRFFQAISSFRASWNQEAEIFHQERFTEIGIL